MHGFIVTGGSKGLGLALSKQLADQGHKVAIISRSAPESYKNTFHIKFDLSDPSGSQTLMDQVFGHEEFSGVEAVGLVNNAATVEPVAKATDLSADPVQFCMQLNLTTPMVMTSAFLARAISKGLNRTIINISSGVAAHPIVGWAAYSASKAGLENFSQCLIDEYGDDDATRVINFNPGIIDTDMQGQIRSSNTEDFPMVQRFKDFKDQGALQTPESVANVLNKLLVGDANHAQGFISVNDLG